MLVGLLLSTSVFSYSSFHPCALFPGQSNGRRKGSSPGAGLQVGDGAEKFRVRPVEEQRLQKTVPAAAAAATAATITVNSANPVIVPVGALVSLPWQPFGTGQIGKRFVCVSRLSAAAWESVCGCCALVLVANISAVQKAVEKLKVILPCSPPFTTWVLVDQGFTKVYLHAR